MYLSLCLIIKDENSYLQEWLDYHILLGVEHFWIYDNESVIPVSDTLKDYLAAGWVTVHTIKGKGRDIQLFAYDHCVHTYQSESKWIGFIDTDEFLVPHTADNMRDFLTVYEDSGGLAISSVFFGSGGNKTRPTNGQVCGYQNRTPEKLSINRLVKMIVQPDKVILPVSPHSFFFKEGFFGINESGLRVDSQNFPCHIDKIQLNHYFTRSDEEWFKKLARWKGDSGDRFSDDRREKINRYSTIEDTRALSLIRKLIEKHQTNPGRTVRKKNIDEKEIVETIHSIVSNMPSPPLTKPVDIKEVFPRQEAVDYFIENNLGRKLLDSGQLPEARTFHANQISKYPFDMIRYTNYAAICLEMGDFKSAWPAIAQAWRIAPRSLYALLCMIDYFYAIGDFSQVEKTSIMALAQGELEPSGVAMLAIAQWKQGKYQEARETANPILSHLKESEIDNPFFRELMDLIHQ
jgi:hypothetical protein